MDPSIAAAEQPVAAVTGATGGIGRWIARGLARAGYHVVLVARDPARAEAARIWIAERVPGASIESVIADLSLLAATREARRAIAASHRKIAVLVNNAGIFEAQRVVTAEGYERVLATNLLSPFVLTRALLPSFDARARRRGSSMSARRRRTAPRSIPIVSCSAALDDGAGLRPVQARR